MRPSGICPLAILLLAMAAPLRSQTTSAPTAPIWQDDALTPATASARGLPEVATRRTEINAAIEARQWDRAERLLAAEIERVPASADAPALLKTLASICLIDRKPLNAAIAIKKAEALGPIDDQTRFALALAYIALQRADWARPELNTLAASQPANTSYQYWLARLDYDDGHYGAAIARLEDVVTRDKTFVRAFDNLGLCHEAQNQPDKALPRYREAVRLNRLAETKSPWPPLNLGILLHHLGQLDEAESLLKESMSYRGRDGDAAAQPDRDAARASYELGTLLERKRRFNEAVGTLANAVKADPTYPEPHYALSRIYRRANKPEQADESLATFQRLRAASYVKRARAYQERAADDPAAAGKALDTWRELLAVDPTNLDALYQSAFLQALRGHFAESRALIDRLPAEARERPQALAVLTVDLAGLGAPARAEATSAATRLAAHPDLTEADIMSVLPAFAPVSDPADVILQQLLQTLDTRGLASAAALRQLADLHLRHGRPAEARQTLERAASKTPTVPVLMDLARVAYKNGDAKGALGYLAHARDLDPRNAGVHFFFGMACIDLNLGAEAYESLKKAIALDPRNPFINYALGAVSIQRHDSSEALPYFETYVRLKPDDPRGRFALGAARFYSNQLEQARDDLRQAAAHPETAAGAHYFLARIARQLNDLETARQEIGLALRGNERNADAWAELGLVQTRSAQYAEAEQSLGKALAIDPRNYAATFNLSTLYSKTKDPRRDEQAARLAALQEQRAAQAQEFLRIIEVSPY